RLIRVEPVIDPERPAAGRLGTIVVEQLLGDYRAPASSDEAIVVQTTLAPVTLRPALAASATTRTPYVFLVPSRVGRVLLEAEVKSADLAAARDQWRFVTRSAAWAVVGLTLLLGCGVLLDIRRRARQPLSMLLATAVVVLVLAIAREILRAAT